nr:ribonuclease H [Ipomoea batatas]
MAMACLGEELESEMEDYLRPDRGCGIGCFATPSPIILMKIEGIVRSKDLVEKMEVTRDREGGNNRQVKFPMARAYDAAVGEREQCDDKDWKLIWKQKVPNKICAFLWLLKHDSAVCSGNGRGETGCRIFDNCKRKIGGGEEKRLVHVFREQNAVADWLAQRAVVGFEERIDHKKPPLGCIKLVQNDRIGGVVVRSLHEEE